MRRSGHTLHPFEEHLDQLIAGLHLGLREETEEETPAPRGMDVTHVAYVEGGRFGRKLAYFGMGNPCENAVWRQDRFQPGQAVQPLPEMGERRLAGWRLHARKLRQSVLHLEEGIQAGLVRERKRVGDL